MALSASRNKAGQTGSPITAIPVRSATGMRTLSALEFAALLPPAAVALLERGLEWLWIPGIAVFAVLIWQRIFAEVRSRPFNPDGIVTALACAIVLPASTSLWQVTLALSFGIVIGQEIFGGRGRNFVNPATVALAFFVFSFPATPLDVLTPALGLSVVPGALLMIAAGLISWRVIVGAVVGLLLAMLATTSGLPQSAMPFAGFAFGLIFLAADPVATASTNPGRWISGALFGATATLLAGTEPPKMEAIVSAALLASIFAPLIDSGVLAVKTYQRERRHG